jgi:Putative zinc-finger
MSERPDAIHEAATLIPWYLSGTLGPDESRAVEQHLTGCASCREKVGEWRRLRPALERAIEARPAPARDLFASVISRIDASARAPVQRALAGASWWERIATAVFGVLPPRLAPAAALAVIVLQFGALAVVGTVAYQAMRGPIVTTQSGPEGRRPLRPGMVRLRVAFQDNAPGAEIRGLLQRLDARIIDGPSAAGFYIIETPATVDGRPAADVFQSGVGIIRFAEPLP